jgi:hypothetical protein
MFIKNFMSCVTQFQTRICFGFNHVFLLAKIANYEFACQCKCLGLCPARITLFHACYGNPCVKNKQIYINAWRP